MWVVCTHMPMAPFHNQRSNHRRPLSHTVVSDGLPVDGQQDVHRKQDAVGSGRGHDVEDHHPGLLRRLRDAEP